MPEKEVVYSALPLEGWGRRILERLLHRALRVLFIVGCSLGGFAPAQACNIPVFRYALERWQADSCQLVVFTVGEPSAAVQSQIDKFNKFSIRASGTYNFDVVTSTGANDEDVELAQLRDVVFGDETAQQRVIGLLRSTPIHGERKILWQGDLNDFQPAEWFESPLRSQLTQRMLNGDSGVWLFFPGQDAARNSELIKLLTTELDRLGDSLPFPSGVGEPGSELYSEIPFTIRFTLLEADPANEQSLVNIFGAMTNVEQVGQEAFVVPVYGRGRALEAFGQEMITPGLVEEVCQFFTGACSCQVKQSNPGFDLPLSVNWMPALFGDQIPPEDAFKTPEPSGDGKPAYVPIPTGKLVTKADALVHSEDLASEPTESSISSPESGAPGDQPELTLPAASSAKSSPAADVEPISIEVIQEPGEAVEIIQEAPFPFARWVAMGIIALGAVLMIAAGRRK